MTNEQIAANAKDQIAQGVNPEDVKRGIYQGLLHAADVAGARDLHDYAASNLKRIWQIVEG